MKEFIDRGGETGEGRVGKEKRGKGIIIILSESNYALNLKILWAGEGQSHFPCFFIL